MQQQGLAENQLAVVRVFCQQAVEALEQAVAGFLVSIGRRQGEEVEMRVALALQDFFHIYERVVVAARARQRNGRGPLCLEVAGVVAGPDQCGVECGLVGAQVFGDAKCALGNARVLGVDCLGHVVVQGDIEAVALASQFRRQKAVDGVLAKRSIDLRLGFGSLGSLFDGRRALL
ncbi:hypothetical protein D9M71_236650 [compost metagenome]